MISYEITMIAELYCLQESFISFTVGMCRKEAWYIKMEGYDLKSGYRDRYRLKIGRE